MRCGINNQPASSFFNSKKYCMKQITWLILIFCLFSCHAKNEQKKMVEKVEYSQPSTLAVSNNSTTNEETKEDANVEKEVSSSINTNSTACVSLADASTCGTTLSYSANAGSPMANKDIPKNQNTVKQKLIRDANISIQVEDYNNAKKKINELIKTSNAYISYEQESKTDDGMTNSITIRCTAEYFDKLIENVTSIAFFVENKTIKAQDVTAEFSDLQTRIKTKKEEEQQYIQILHRAIKISDVLEVENQLRIIREEIESAEGRFKLMADQVDYSTIELTFHEKGKTISAPENGFFFKIKNGLVNGWNIILEIIIGLTNLWPFVLTFTMIGFFVKKKYFKATIKTKD
ncbi:MAG: hypothetical protein RL708_12 [Bacteroidota bacterium]